MKYEVWNKHPHGLIHKEKFKGDDIVIPANGFVLMDYEDAVQFKGQMVPMIKTGMGTQDPASFKCIHLVAHKGDSVPTPVPEYVCNMDGKKFTSQKELDEYVAANFADDVFKDPALEKDAQIAATIKGTKK
jgi:hypothetical protein